MTAPPGWAVAMAYICGHYAYICPKVEDGVGESDVALAGRVGGWASLGRVATVASGGECGRLVGIQ